MTTDHKVGGSSPFESADTFGERREVGRGRREAGDAREAGEGRRERRRDPRAAAGRAPTREYRSACQPQLKSQQRREVKGKQAG